LNNDDLEFLTDVYRALDERKKIPNTIKLEEWQKKKIEESIQQIERGEFKTSEEVFKEIDQWLLKK
jgi:predicted transcriptional regulator